MLTTYGVRVDQGDRFLWDLLFSVWRCGESKRSVFGGVLVVVVVMVVVVQCSVTVGWPP